MTGDSSPAGFTARQTFTTNGGAINTQTGGTNAFTTTNEELGLTNVTYAEGTISSSTDPAVTTAGKADFSGFAKVPSLNLQYASFGLWAIAPCGPSDRCTPAYLVAIGGGAGGVSPTASMPTGTATYNGLAIGVVQQPIATNTTNVADFRGAIGLTANFGAGTILGQIAGLQALSNEDSSVLGSLNDIGLSGTISGSSYTGTAAVIGRTGSAFNIAGATGSFTGSFYGPGAAETAGAFYLSGGANSTNIVGSFGTKIGGEMLTQFREVATIGSGAGGSLTATLTPQLSGVKGILTAFNDSSPPGFTATTPFLTKVTPTAGAVVGRVGGSNYVNTVTEAGQTNVTALGVSIVSSTDAAITTGGGGEVLDFADAAGLSYSAFGTWTLQPCDNNGSCQSTYAGTFAGSQGGTYQTPLAGLPTGSATYTGGATGFVVQPVANNPQNVARFYGTASLTANFSTKAITGGISSITAYGPDSGPALGTINNIGLTATISGTAFNGTTSVTGGAGTAFNIGGTGAQGTVNGAFYGPAAQEAAGVFNITGGPNNTTLMGSFGAVK